MDLTEDDQEVVGYEAVNEDQWLFRLDSMLGVIYKYFHKSTFTRDILDRIKLRL